CSLIIPKYIRKLAIAQQKKQSDILNYSIPWTYLFLYANNNSHLGLADALSNALSHIRDRIAPGAYGLVAVPDEKFPEKQSKKPRMQWENPEPKQLVSKELPKVAMNLLSGRIPATKSPLGGISIVSTVPVRGTDTINTNMSRMLNNATSFEGEI